MPTFLRAQRRLMSHVKPYFFSAGCPRDIGERVGVSAYRRVGVWELLASRSAAGTGGRAPARSASAHPMVISGVPPPMVDALRRVRRRRSGTRLWTCCAGRAGTRIRLEAPHRILTIGRPAADRAGARPYHPIGIASSDRQTQGVSSLKPGLYDRATAPIQDYPVQ